MYYSALFSQVHVQCTVQQGLYSKKKKKLLLFYNPRLEDKPKRRHMSRLGHGTLKPDPFEGHAATQGINWISENQHVSLGHVVFVPVSWKNTRIEILADD